MASSRRAAFVLVLAMLSPVALRAQLDVAPAPLAPLVVTAMVHDASTNVLVQLGGVVVTTEGFDTLFDGEGFEIGRLPTRLVRPTLAHDPSRGVLQAFGFQWGHGQVVHEGRGAQWVTFDLPFATPLANAVFVRHAARGVAVVAGYLTGSSHDLQIWEWSAGTAQLRLQVARASLQALAAVENTASGEIWFVESLNPTTRVSSWDGTTLRTLSTAFPGAVEMRCVFDPQTGQLVALGGTEPANGFAASYATRTFDGATWRTLALHGIEPGTAEPTTDRLAGRVLARATTIRVGTELHTRPAVYAWDGVAWNAVPGSERLPLPTSLATATDSAGVTRLQVGHAAIGPRNEYAFDGERFTYLGGGPPGVLLGYDAVRDRFVALESGTSSTATWETAGGVWALAALGGYPTGRFAIATGFDGSRLIAFGGRTFGGVSAETWSYDANGWVRLTPATTPAARGGAVMAFDARRRRLVMCGSDDATRPVETWEWDGADWHLAATGPMTPRTGFVLGWHAARARIVLFGGVRADGVRLGDAWEWDGAAWSSTAIVGAVPVGSAAQAFVPGIDGALVHVAEGLTTFGSARPASYTTFATGCPGSAGTASLSLGNSDRPWLGETITVDVHGLPPPPRLASLLTGVSSVRLGAWTLPLSLATFGAAGCTLRVSNEVVSPLVVRQGTASWSIAIPNDVALVGRALYQQPLVTDPGANALGVVLGNAAVLRLGRR